MNDLITQIFEVCIIPLLGVLTTFVVKYLSAKIGEVKLKTDNEIANKYLDMIQETVTKCVIATNQTYVETLKKQGKFDADAQKEAFNMTLNAVLLCLSNDAFDYIDNITGDVSTYLKQQIEAAVNENK